MNDLLSRLASMDPEKREAILHQMPGYLIQAGRSEELYTTIEDKNWYMAHREYDPTLRGYTTSLDTALREFNEQSTALAHRIVVLYLRSSVQSIQTNIPAQVITEISRSGDIQQARYLASQRTDPLERCDAFLKIASMQAVRGERFGASETLQSAFQAVQQISSIEIRMERLFRIIFKFIELRNLAQVEKLLQDVGSLFPRMDPKNPLLIRSKIYLLIASYLTNNNPDVFLTGLLEVFQEISSLPDTRMKGHLLKLLTSWAKHLESKDLYEESSKALIRIFIEPLKPKNTFTRPSFLPTPQFPLSQGAERDSIDTILTDLQRTVKSFDLSKNVKNLLALLEWDQKGGQGEFYREGEALAAVIRAADKRNDQSTLKNISEKLSSRSRDDMDYDGLSSCSELIESLAEVGLVDAAIELIAEHLVYIPDDSRLREALAHGAGKRGDIRMIYRAVEPISPKHPPEGIGDRLSRWKDTISHSLENQAAGLMIPGYSKRIEILLSGYEELSTHHPSLAKEFLERLLNESNEKSRAIITKTLNNENVEPYFQGRFFSAALSTFGTVRKWVQKVELLHNDFDDLSDSEVGLFLLRKQYEQAIQIAEQMKSESFRNSKFWDIAFALMDDGRTKEAFAIAQRVTVTADRQHLIGVLTEKLSKLSNQDTNASELSSQFQRMPTEEELLNSNALPAMFRSLLVDQSIGHILEKVRVINSDLVIGCLTPCAEVIARNRDREGAQKLLPFYDRSPDSIMKVRNLASLAITWASIEPLTDLAANVLQQALDLYTRLDLARFKVQFPLLKGQESQEGNSSNPLPQLASAARILGDEKTLGSIRKLALGQAQDEAKVQVVVADYIKNGKGINSEVYIHDIGYQLEKEYLISSSLYRGLALAELAFAVRKLPPEIYYRHNPKEKRELLGDYILEKSSNTIFRAMFKALKFVDKNVTQDELESALKEIGGGVYESWDGALAEDARSGLKRRSDALLKEAQYLIVGKPSDRFSSLQSKEAVTPPFLEKLIRLYTRHRAWNSMQELVKAFKDGGSPLLPEIITLCMKELVLVKQFGKINGLAELLPEQKRPPAVQIYLAISGHAKNEYDKLNHFIKDGMDPQTIQAIGIAIGQINGIAVRRKLAENLLRLPILQGRKSFLMALEYLAPLGSNLMGLDEWRKCVFKIFQLDSCWTDGSTH